MYAQIKSALVFAYGRPYHGWTFSLNNSKPGYNRVKRQNSKKKITPFFKGFGNCNQKGCSVSVHLTISAANENSRQVEVH